MNGVFERGGGYLHNLHALVKNLNMQLKTNKRWSKKNMFQSTFILILLTTLLCRVTLKGWDFRDDCTEYLQTLPLYTLGSKELGNLKSRHWDLYGKPDASIGIIKKPQNIVFSMIKKDFRTF